MNKPTLLQQQFVRQIILRNGRKLIVKRFFPDILTNCEKDELLICSRLAKRAL